MQNVRTSPSQPTTADAKRDPSADLLLAATRTFCERDRPSREEIDLYREAFYAKVHHLPTATRQSVATLLSHNDFCPRPIALFLAMDVPAVAHSILRRSTVLGERDLEQIVARCTPIHARLLAARPHLPDALVQRLSEIDDADIHAALMANSSLSLQDDAVREPEPSAPARRQVERRSTSGEARLLQALARTGPRAAAGRTEMGLDEFKAVFEEAAMRRDRKAMVAAMRARFDLRHDTAVQALDDRTGDALQVMMKAEGFDAASANRIVMLAIPAVGLSPAAAERALHIWSRLRTESCQTAFAEWPRREPVTRHMPLQSDAEGSRREDRATAVKGAQTGSVLGTRRTG